MTSLPLCRNDIFAPGNDSGFFLSRTGEQIFSAAADYCPSLIDDQQFLTESVDFIPVVGDQDHCSLIILQNLLRLLLPLVVT